MQYLFPQHSISQQTTVCLICTRVYKDFTEQLRLSIKIKNLSVHQNLYSPLVVGFSIGKKKNPSSYDEVQTTNPVLQLCYDMVAYKKGDLILFGLFISCCFTLTYALF